ncbi:hypothetical protein [Mycobacterium sp. IS-1496]|uniref:hypothetical protein n=1 Tax=Mycobacterium sp. IS-1496 TaxID=1772284 RepID=UPI0012F9FDAB|nr:hypothetical protein [Mycobacterium sp. IS-1496]
MTGYDLNNQNDRDDRRKHLDLIAAVIGRMGTASAQAKGWSITLAGAAFGVAVLRENAWPLIVLGVLVLAVFAKIDAHYLSVEKDFRDLHEAVRDNQVKPLSMETSQVPRRPSNPSYSSWSIKWFYAPLMAAGVLLLAYSCANPNAEDTKTNVVVNVPSYTPPAVSTPPHSSPVPAQVGPPNPPLPPTPIDQTAPSPTARTQPDK